MYNVGPLVDIKLYTAGIVIHFQMFRLLNDPERAAERKESNNRRIRSQALAGIRKQLKRLDKVGGYDYIFVARPETSQW